MNPEARQHQDAARALACLDLTDLGDAATAEGALALCVAAGAPRKVAAVCLWPRFVALVSRELARSGVKVATVANFPSGEEKPASVRATIEKALEDGADEVDVVIPYRHLIAGRKTSTRTLLRTARAAVLPPARLKVILETGAYTVPSLIGDAAGIAIEEGADFLKTSTGKSEVSATPPAARLLLEAAKAAGRPVGVKISGGVRSLADATIYLSLADEIMGPDFVAPSTFRFGASSLRASLLAALGEDTTWENKRESLAY